jgi:hypothetical protein
VAPKDGNKKGIRARIGRVLFKVPFLRRFYARRLLSFMEKSQAKHRPLPPELQELKRILSRFPKHQQLAVLEQTLEAQDQEPSSRELRRAVSRQQRQSGRHGGRRPGTVMSRQWQAPPSGPVAPKPSKTRRSKS